MDKTIGNAVMAVYSPDGDQVASCSSDKTVRLWDVETGVCVHILEGHTHMVISISYSEKNQIASGSHDRTVRLWSTETGECLLEIAGFNGSVEYIDFHNQYLITGCDDKSVRCWQIIKEQEKYRALLCWSSSHDALTASGASFNGVQGLSEVNQKLLRQCGASIPPSLYPEQGA